MRRLTSRGELRLNLDSGEIVRLRMVTDCTFKPGELPGCRGVLFVDELTLRSDPQRRTPGARGPHAESLPSDR